MDYKHSLKESELVSHIKLLQFSLQSGSEEFQTMLETGFSSSNKLLESRQEQIQQLRRHPDLLEICHKELESLKDSEALLKSFKPNETSKVSEGQIFFQGEHTKALNFVPYCLAACVFLKVWIVPIFALFTPFLLFIMPYLIMKTVMDLPITWEMYKVLMKQMVLGIQPNEGWKLKHYGQAFWTLASMGQSIVSPFMTAYHTNNLSAEIIKRGNALLMLHRSAKKVVDLLGDKVQLYLPEIPSEPHECAAWMEAEPLGMKQIWKVLGTLSVYIQIARDESWIPVTWTSQAEPFELSSFYDLAIQNPVKSDIYLKQHSLLTGPNRGGKSSCLRAILQQVILGQVTGFTYRTKGSWKPFRLLFTRLKSVDTAGKESLFEMEVRHASQMIKAIEKYKSNTLILIDELFHSTNPPDAETSAKLFLKLLWSHSNTKSIVSTHIFSLCEKSKIQLFACQATEDQEGQLIYSYKLSEGSICRTSSVREVLRESGLLCA
jgi:hypothetical protein